MALHYIIDGYNFLGRCKIMKSKKLDPAIRLTNFFITKNLQRSKRNKITIIFDGYPSDKISSGSSIEIIYSKTQSADDYIISYLKKVKDKSSYCVVSDDRELRLRVKLLGVKGIDVMAFLHQAGGKSRSYKNISDKPYLFSPQAMKITKELEKVWLRKE